MLTRRDAIIAVLAIPLGKFTAFASQGPANLTRDQASATPVVSKALLTINLDQWGGIKVTMGKRSTIVTSADIFDVLTTKE